MKNLTEGISIMREIGQSDVILLAASYSFDKGLISLPTQFGMQMKRRYPDVQEKISGLLTLRKKSIKKNLFAICFDVKVRAEQTAVGIWQCKYTDKDTVDHDLMNYSLNRVAYWSETFDRVAIELPGREWGVDDSKINKYLDMLPDHVIIYRSMPINEKMIQIPAHNDSKRINYSHLSRTPNPNNYHRR